MSSIIPVLHNLATKVLKETQDDGELTKTIKKITDYLKGKYSESTIQDILHKATFSDPRFKLDYIEGANREMLEDNTLNEGMEILTLTASPTSSVQTTPQTEGAEKELLIPKKKRLVTSLKKSPDSEISGSSVSGNTRTPLQKLKSEIDAYKIISQVRN